MSAIRKFAKKVPGAQAAYQSLRRLNLRRRLQNATTDQVFTDIFKKNRWGGKVSLSGPGSDLDQTRVLFKELPALLTQLHIKTILDIPSGDFYWMSRLNLVGISYIGADIVKELVGQNQARYRRTNVQFRILNLLQDDLPCVDLILCRDCLVHFSFKDVFSALSNIRRSGSTWFLTTTYPEHLNNVDILTGDWRPLNLIAPPFNLPGPLRLINEECTECDGLYRDKSMGLWRIEDV